MIIRDIIVDMVSKLEGLGKWHALLLDMNAKLTRTPLVAIDKSVLSQAL